METFYFIIGVIALVGVSALLFTWLVVNLQQVTSSKYSHVSPSSMAELYTLHNFDYSELDEMRQDDWEIWEKWQEELDQAEAISNAAIEKKLQKDLELKAKREAERQAINQDFPDWLIEFGAEFSVTSYRGMAELAQYIGAILTYGSEHFDGTLPIRKCYTVANEGKGFGKPAPQSNCTGRAFFERLSWVLARNGLLLDNSSGTRGRGVAENALIKLRPASSEQCPSVQNPKNAGVINSFFSKPGEPGRVTPPLDGSQ